MAPMSLYKQHRRRLLSIARDSIGHGVKTGRPLAIENSEQPPELQTKTATFVTLKINNQLRGCVGMLEAQRPLANDIAHNAFAAAFQDPRFTPIDKQELEQLTIHISILTPPTQIPCTSEIELLNQLRPGIDGLILVEGSKRSTFLPAVWESLPASENFLKQLKIKAGLPAEYWSDSLSIFRYTTITFE